MNAIINKYINNVINKLPGFGEWGAMGGVVQKEDSD